MKNSKSDTASYVLGLLFVINLLNYVDRQVLYAVFPLIKPELHLSDTQLGALASAFMIVYMCAAPVVGWFGDRTARNRWIGGGVGLWSVATVLSGLARTYPQLLFSRSLVGVGEANYGSLSPSFVAEYFPESRRGRVLAIFSMAIPVGSAFGYVLGGLLGARWGWRAAFLMVGLPGLLAASLATLLKDPRPAPVAKTSCPGGREYLKLLDNKVYITDTLALAAQTFALGGLAAWLPSFFVRQWGVGVADAGTWFGGVTVAAGALGSLAGGWLGDWGLRRTPRAYFILSGLGLALSVPLGLATLFAGALKTALAFLFFTEFFVFLNTGPLNALIADSTPLSMRSMAFAANIFAIHALGDAASPTVIGWASDIAGLRTALTMTIGALAAAAGLCFWGCRYIPLSTLP